MSVPRAARFASIRVRSEKAMRGRYLSPGADTMKWPDFNGFHVGSALAGLRTRKSLAIWYSV